MVILRKKAVHYKFTNSSLIASFSPLCIVSNCICSVEFLEWNECKIVFSFYFLQRNVYNSKRLQRNGSDVLFFMQN